MDFPQQPQGATPFPAAPQPTTPPPFPNMTPNFPSQPNAPMADTSVGNPMMSMPNAGPMPGPTMPAMAPTAPVQIPVQSHPSNFASDEQVYTMPEKFLASTTAPAPKRSKQSSKAVTIILITVIALMVLGAIGGVLYYFLVLAKQTPTDTNAQNSVVVNNTNNANTVANTNNANANGNVNGNANSNANSNANANTNGNTNAVANGNTNATNQNTNANNNANNNANANSNTNSNTVTVPPAGKDTDADKLTNDEEAIWATKADMPDTDSDGYADGVEILAGYDPTNPTGRLATSALVGTFSNSAYHYTMFYPKNWLAEALAEGDAKEVLFTPNTLDLSGQFVAVTVSENPTGLTAVDWYTDTANLDEDEVETVTSFSALQGVWSTDRTTAYYADSDYVYAISYRYGNSDELYFPSTFELMVKSFALAAQ